MNREIQPSRTLVRGVVCPACHARPTAPCMGARGRVRESNHMERVDAYLRANPQWTPR